jgi:adenylosuccinate lyase
MAELSEKITANPNVMRQNLNSLNGLAMSERVTSELIKKIGREEAVEIVTEACRAAIVKGTNLSDILKADDRVMKHLTTNEINELMSPEGYLGTALNI